MKILLTGGETGGHFYPLIAVAEEIRAVAHEKKLLNINLYYMSNTPYNAGLLFDNGIEFIKVPSGKYRRYFSLMNFIDLFKIAWGVVYGFIQMFTIYPDVVFSKGGGASFPALFAARILGIPVVIHESDTHPGKVSLWSSKFAIKVAVSYPEAESFFPKGKTAWTGNPIRNEIKIPTNEGAYEFLKLDRGVPVLFILGGSQGSKIINDTILRVLPTLLKKYQIIHQVGTRNIEDISGTAGVILENNENKDRYKPFAYLDPLALRMVAGVTELVISRAGSSLFEIAQWGLPSIIIPISDSNGDHQRKNAFAYARAGAAVVIEEMNLTPEIILAQIEELIGNTIKLEKMKTAARNFSKPDAARVIAEGLISTSLTHEA